MTNRLLDVGALAVAGVTLILVAVPAAGPLLPWLKATPALGWALSLALTRAPAWPLMALALVLAGGGDWLLADGRWPVFGAGAFAAMQILYAVRFWGLAFRRPEPRNGLAVTLVALAVVTAVVVGQLWPRLGPQAPAMAVYAGLLTLAAAGGAAAGRGPGLTAGALLFYLSDAMILAVRAFGLEGPWGEWIVLFPYWAGQFLIVRDQRRTA